jgi:hypothetical protein
MKKKSIKKTKIEYHDITEADKYRKYKRRKGGFEDIKPLMNGIISLAIGTMAMDIMLKSLTSAGVLETKSHSRIGTSGGNNGQGHN